MEKRIQITMSSTLVKRLRDYISLMRLDKPIGIFLLLWPALWALLVASEGQPDPRVLLIFVLGVVLMRSAGCVINDFADREIDRHVSRTQNRPLTAGRVTTREALILFGLLALGALLLVLQLNRLTILLSIVGAFLAVSYPFMKRVTYLPQVYLGAAFGWAVPMAFAAELDSVPPIAWLMFVATVLWATAYDTMYAMVDRMDDIALGVKSTAILFGESDRQIIGLIQGMMLVCLVMIGYQAELGWIYHLGLCAAAALAGYQQYLIRFREREACFHAFLNNNWLGGVVFLGILLDYMLR
jgi:4-hydroxybenzoate polyprenyltransferase